jgi:3-hydroxybutyryl-CoA dehydrogenase
MKVGVIGAGTMGQGIAKAFAQVEGYEVALCDIKQEWAEGGKEKIKKGYARLVEKGKMTQEAVDGILAKITPGLKEDLCKDCDLIVEAAFENMEVKKTTFFAILNSPFNLTQSSAFAENLFLSLSFCRKMLLIF